MFKQDHFNQRGGLMNSMQGILENRGYAIQVFFLGGVFLVLFFLMDPTWAVTVEALKVPITALKNEIFGAWMTVVKICAVAAGIVMSAFKGSLAPFGLGAGLTAGIHLYGSYLGADPGAAALI